MALIDLRGCHKPSIVKTTVSLKHNKTSAYISTCTLKPLIHMLSFIHVIAYYLFCLNHWKGGYRDRGLYTSMLE